MVKRRFTRTGGYRKPIDKSVRSNFEATIKRSLEKKNVQFSYESLKVPYTVTHTYKPDFVLANGIIVEAKGLFLPEDRTKHLYVKKQHPNLDIRFLFQQDQWLTNSRKSKYSTWCKKHGFQYHIGTMIPQAWIDEEKKQ